jgi:hypothetical protein
LNFEDNFDVKNLFSTNSDHYINENRENVSLIEIIIEFENLWSCARNAPHSEDKILNINITHVSLLEMRRHP